MEPFEKPLANLYIEQQIHAYMTGPLKANKCKTEVYKRPDPGILACQGYGGELRVT